MITSIKIKLHKNQSFDKSTYINSVPMWSWRATVQTCGWNFEGVFITFSVQIDAIQKFESGDEMLLLFKLLRIIQRRIADFDAYSLCSMKSARRRNSLLLKPFRHMEPFIECRSHIFLLREVLEEWKNYIQKLKTHTHTQTNKKWLWEVEGKWLNYLVKIYWDMKCKSLYLCVMWLPSRKWNAWNSIQWLQQKTEWIVIDNNNSAWIPWYAGEILHMLPILPVI